MLRTTLLGFDLAKKSPEGDEVLPGQLWVTRQGNRLELRRCLGDHTAEHEATHSRDSTTPSDLTRCFPSNRGAVYRSFARDHEVVAGWVEADEVEDERRTG